jgi:hypothetical protein
MDEATQRIDKFREIAQKPAFLLNLGYRVLEEWKCGARAPVEGHNALGIFGFRQMPAQSVQRNDRSARIIDAKNPPAANASVQIGLWPEGSGFLQGLNREMVAHFLRAEGHLAPYRGVRWMERAVGFNQQGHLNSYFRGWGDHPNRRNIMTLYHGCFLACAHAPQLIDLMLKQPPRHARVARKQQIEGPKGSATAQDFLPYRFRYVVLKFVHLKMKTRINSKLIVLHTDGTKSPLRKRSLRRHA